MAEWLAAAGDIATTYVSNRRGDDPVLHHRVAIIANADAGPSHLSCTVRSGHLNRVLSGQQNEHRTLSDPPSRVEFGMTCLGGGRVRGCADQATMI